MSDDRFRVTLYRPLPGRRELASVAIDSREMEVQWSTTLSGGYGACTITVPPDAIAPTAALPIRSTDVVPNGHGEVTRGGFACFAGQVDDTGWENGALTEIVLKGYAVSGLDDLRFTSDDDRQQYTAAEAIAHILRACAPHLSIGPQWEDPGVAYTLKTFNALYASEAIDRIIKAGGTDGNIWDFGYWREEEAFLLPRVAPTRADYHVSRARWRENYGNMISQCSVTYEEDGVQKTTPVVEDLAALDRIGRKREAVVEGGQLSTAGAQAFARAYLAIHGVPERPFEVTDTLSYPGGAPVPNWRVRAGEWVSVLGASPEIITQTTYSSKDDQLSVQLGEGHADEPDLFRHLIVTSRKLERRINLNTGGKERTV